MLTKTFGQVMDEALTIHREEIAFGGFDGFNSSHLMSPDDILWPPPPIRTALSAADVHIWAAHLDVTPVALSRLASTLSPEERQRASRFRFGKHRDRFIAGRGILRKLLADYLNGKPDEIRFEYSANGKPFLAGPFAESGLFFNIAHSESLALIGVTELGPIGVDIEKIRSVANADELVERFFSARENLLFQSLPAAQRENAFFNLWTRKEAWLKATGEGIGHLLNRVEVTFLPEEPVQLFALPEDLGMSSDWALRELSPANGFIGAVALPGKPFTISNFRFCSECS